MLFENTITDERIFTRAKRKTRRGKEEKRKETLSFQITSEGIQNTNIEGFLKPSLPSSRKIFIRKNIEFLILKFINTFVFFSYLTKQIGRKQHVFVRRQKGIFAPMLLLRTRKCLYLSISKLLEHTTGIISTASLRDSCC